jgi:hypothetical protein
MTAPTCEAATERTADGAVLIVIVAIGVAVRAYYLSLPMKYDEAFTFLEYGQYSFWNAISNYSAPNNQVLNTLLIYFSTNVFGNHDWAVRLPAFISGNLLIPATYVLGRIFSNSDAALVAAALVAGSSKLVEYSVNGRGYALLGLLCIALVAIGVRLIRADTPGAWAVFGVVAAAGFFTIPTMLYVYVAVVLWISARRRWNSAVLKRIFVVSCATFSMIAVLYSPVLFHSGLRALLFNKYLHPLGLYSFLYRAPTLPLYLWDSWTNAVPGPVLIALLVGLAAAIFRDANLAGLLLSFLISVVGLSVIQRIVPPSRVLLFGFPIVAICASSGLMHLLSRWRDKLRLPLLKIAAVVLAAWMGLAVIRAESVIASEETGSFQDIAEVTNFLNGVATPDDLVIMVLPADQPFRYYLLTHATNWAPVYSLRHTTDYVLQGPDDRPAGKLLIVIRDHHGPISSKENEPVTLDRIRRFFTARTGAKLAFSGPYSSVYIVDGATIEHGFCQVFCFHRTRIGPWG